MTRTLVAATLTFFILVFAILTTPVTVYSDCDSRGRCVGAGGTGCYPDPNGCGIRCTSAASIAYCGGPGNSYWTGCDSSGALPKAGICPR